MLLSEIIPPITLLVPPVTGAISGYRIGGTWGLGIGFLIGMMLALPSFFGFRRLRLDGPAMMLFFPWIFLVGTGMGLLLAVLFSHPVFRHAP